MANILGLITINDMEVLSVDANPMLASTPAPAGSIASWDDSGVGHLYLATATDTWDELITVGSSGQVAAGAQLDIPVYDQSGTNSHVGPTVLQNSQAMGMAFAAQPTRSAPITYTIPNPGDAVTAASFVLTEGAQTINGNKTFGNNVIVSGDFTVNGTTTYINTTNLNVTDKLITLNKGGIAASAGGAGIEFEENSSITGFFKVATDRLGYLFRAPALAQSFQLDLSLLTGLTKISVPPVGVDSVFLARDAADPGVAGQLAYYSDANLLTSSSSLTFDGSQLSVSSLIVNGTSELKGDVRITQASAAQALYKISQHQVNTTNATATQIAQVEVTGIQDTLIEVRILGHRTGGSAGTAGDCAAYIRTLRVKNVSGTVSIVTNQSDFTSEDQNSWDVSFVVSTTFINIMVKGAANNNVTWTATVIEQN